MDMPKVAGAVKQEDFQIGLYRDSFGESFFIFYKDVPLWRTGVPLHELEIFLYDGSKAGETFTLMCKDCFDDYFAYGMWSTLEEAMQWLENPVQLY